MRIIKNNGQVIECSVEEYKQLIQNDKEPSIELETYGFEPEKMLQNIKPRVTSMALDREKYRQEVEGDKYKKSSIASSRIVRGYKGLRSCYSRWTREEDLIVMNNILEDCIKKLPDRTRIAIISRRSDLKHDTGVKPLGYNKKFYSHSIENKSFQKSGTRISSCKRWKKYEDTILRRNSVDESYKILQDRGSNRSKIAIYDRMIVLRKNHKKQGRLIRSNDKRIRMMQIVSSKTKELLKTMPNSSRPERQKIAMQYYRDLVSKEEKERLQKEFVAHYKQGLEKDGQ